MSAPPDDAPDFRRGQTSGKLIALVILVALVLGGALVISSAFTKRRSEPVMKSGGTGTRAKGEED